MGVLLELELDGLPPTVNSMYRSMRGGQRYKVAECRDYQYRVSGVMRSQWQGEPYLGRAELKIEYRTKDKRRWDIDNRVKALQDCLIASGVLKDDCQIDSLHVQRVHSNVTGTYLRLSEYESIPS